jgi:hypothetical protein
VGTDGPLHAAIAGQVEDEVERASWTGAAHGLVFPTVRRARNRPTLASSPTWPTRAEIHRGISIVARMLVYRIARLDSPRIEMRARR